MSIWGYKLNYNSYSNKKNIKENTLFCANKRHFTKNSSKYKVNLIAYLIAATCILPSYGIAADGKNLDIPQTINQIGNNGSISDSKFVDTSYDPFNVQTEAKPAWAQGAYQQFEFNKLKPFGSELFQGNFATTYQTDINPDYKVTPGDRIVVRMWGAKSYEDILTVDLQGNIFIPEIGPVQVLGCSVSSLVGTIKSAVSKVFTDNVNLYVNLQNSQPIAVFVTGNINNPGRYAGSQNDNVLSYIDRAGGINSLLGSYRTIVVKRNSEIIKTIDLYNFLVYGEIPIFTLKNNDVIVIGSKYLSVSAYGLIKKPASYEFTKTHHLGSDLISIASIGANVSHVQISGFKDNTPFNKYLSLSEFSKYELNPDDKIMFISDNQKETILTSVVGPIKSKSRFIVKKGTNLLDVLKNVQIDESVADCTSVYIKRKSVAEQQKIIIDEALKRLEQSSLTAESGSVDEANIRVKEAELIQDFVKRAKNTQPDGIVVVSANGKIKNLILEDGDEIIIPQKTNVIQIGGEVMMPKAIVYDESYNLLDYINETGGFSQRADEENILVILPNGQVGKIEQLKIQPGARIIVMPRVDTKKMQFAKDIMQIIYQIAVATKVAIGL